MKIAVGSDMNTDLTAFVVKVLQEKGYVVGLFGALAPGEGSDWPAVGATLGTAVAKGDFDQGVLFCWTGTGVSIAANKVKGIRAALCTDAETASGARKWNDANVLCMSLRLVSAQVATEILEAWLATEPSEGSDDQACLRYLDFLEGW
ncbi:MAG: RpiB/LacA/LacB family sugar-phosphate isomerase [Saprospiraceae bacterium]|jgi:ribose 5-phosphate isomerase B|nr:RpiB/LacA/LacB family sugar-phosphate isomerase [Saprospiraceae bacterium]